MIRPPRARWLDAALTLAAAGVILFVAFECARARELVADYYPLNGAFQCFDPIRRLVAGQWIGRDFDAYLGLGPTYLTRLLTLVLGVDFLSVLRAGQAASLLAHVATVVLLARLVGARWWVAASFGALAASLVASPTPWWLPQRVAYWIIGTTYPLHALENSALGLRCAAPTLAVAAWLVVRGLVRGPRAAACALGAIAGCSLVWSNDYGPATCVALLGSCLLVPFPETRPLGRVRVALFAAGSCALAALTVATCATGGAPLAWLSYNLGVLRDQHWFFVFFGNAYAPDPPLFVPPSFGVLLAAGLVFKARSRAARPADALLLVLVLSALVAGTLPALSNPQERYYFPLYRVAWAVAPYLLLSALAELAVAVRARRPSWPRLAALRPVVGLLPAAALLASVPSTWSVAHAAHRTVLGTVDAPELGGRLVTRLERMLAVGRELRRELEAAGVPPERRMFSTYVGALDLVVGAMSPARVDYAIHALGPGRRDDYVTAFRTAEPAYVTTIRSDLIHWEQWLRSSLWGFYRELLERYDPCERTSHVVVWRRRSEPRALLEIPAVCTLLEPDADGPACRVELAEGMQEGRWVVEVELRYETVRGWRRSTAVARYEGTDHKLVAFGLAPYEPAHRFPVELSPGQSVRIELRSLASGPAPRLVGASARVVASARLLSGRVPDRRLIAASRTDPHVWSHGVQRQLPVFHVGDRRDLRGLRVGDRLRFAGSGLRTVVAIRDVQVTVDGGLLQPLHDGWPHWIEVVR